MDGLDIPPHDPDFLKDVIEGLSGAQKSVPSRWLYDQYGSELFERITELPEYYPTRTERAILVAYATAMAHEIGPGATLIEYGAGAAVKTRLLLDALSAPCAYAPVDISENFLKDTVVSLRADYPQLPIIPVIGDFLSPIDLGSVPTEGRVGFFPGSTIGNLTDAEIIHFFRSASQSLGREAKFLLGFDLRKSESILIPAYDDAEGVTAAFNLNLLTRINRELDGTFDLSGFKHEARWNDGASQVEMHLVSVRDQTCTVAGQSFAFRRGESIHTEISRKFSLEALRETLSRSGWSIARTWQDPDAYFCLALLAQ